MENIRRRIMRSLHEHEWYLTVDSDYGVGAQCDCADVLLWEELEQILNNPTVKDIINKLISTRESNAS